jgi:hypothetical protein
MRKTDMTKTIHNTIRTALLCGALAFTTSAMAQVSSGSLGAGLTAKPPTANAATNATGSVAAPGVSGTGNAQMSTSTSPNGVTNSAGVNANTASPISDTGISGSASSKSKHHRKATPASDTRVNTGVSTPNASTSTGTSVTTDPNAATTNTSTDTNVSTPQPH